jgi:hypothetical protein
MAIRLVNKSGEIADERGMPVSQLVYLSRATMHVDRAELVDITNVSVANNRGRDVTGALLFCNGYFLQILEGTKEVVEQLLAKISTDERHADVQVLERREASQRAFGEWGMACLHEASMTSEQAERASICIGQISDPLLVDRIGNDAHQLLVDLQDAIAAESAKLAA